LAESLGVCPDALKLTVQQMSRRSERRLLAALWNIAYEVEIAKANVTIVMDIAFAIHRDKAAFSDPLWRRVVKLLKDETPSRSEFEFTSFTELTLMRRPTAIFSASISSQEDSGSADNLSSGNNSSVETNFTPNHMLGDGNEEQGINLAGAGTVMASSLAAVLIGGGLLMCYRLHPDKRSNVEELKAKSNVTYVKEFQKKDDEGTRQEPESPYAPPVQVLERRKMPEPSPRRRLTPLSAQHLRLADFDEDDHAIAISSSPSSIGDSIPEHSPHYGQSPHWAIPTPLASPHPDTLLEIAPTPKNAPSPKSVASLPFWNPFSRLLDRRCMVEASPTNAPPIPTKTTGQTRLPPLPGSSFEEPHGTMQVVRREVRPRPERRLIPAELELEHIDEEQTEAVMQQSRRALGFASPVNQTLSRSPVNRTPQQAISWHATATPSVSPPAARASEPRRITLSAPKTAFNINESSIVQLESGPASQPVPPGTPRTNWALHVASTSRGLLGKALVGVGNLFSEDVDSPQDPALSPIRVSVKPSSSTPKSTKSFTASGLSPKAPSLRGAAQAEPACEMLSPSRSTCTVRAGVRILSRAPNLPGHLEEHPDTDDVDNHAFSPVHQKVSAREVKLSPRSLRANPGTRRIVIG